MTCDEVKPLLNARMDGEIDSAQSAALDSHLADCPSCARDLERLYDIRIAIRGGMPYHTAPPALRDQVRFALRGADYLDRAKTRRPWRMWGSVAAAFVVCVLASALFLVNRHNQRILVADEFLSAHQRALIGRAVDVVSSDQHTVKPWFNGKLAFAPEVIYLVDQGFPLVGGRLHYIDNRTVAALVYQRRKHSINLFIWPSTRSDQAEQQFSNHGYNIIHWTRSGASYWAVSDVNSADLGEFAKLVSR